MEGDWEMFENIERDRILFDENIVGIPRRYIRDMENPLNFYTTTEFRKRYRFHKQTIMDIIMPMVEGLNKPTNKGLPISPLISVLLTLRFYATASFQTVCGDLRGVSQSTASRTVAVVSRLFAGQAQNYIKFPNNDEGFRRNKQQFQAIAGFPDITGCIDCTHILIKSPGGPYAEIFRNRKRSFSINVQAVSGPNGEILDIVARYPGREHDSNIFNRSMLKARFERQLLRGYLLGDAGYPCLPYLLTPFRVPATPGERRYNNSQILTRNVIERTFGILKRRFPCLSRGLGNKVETTCTIIVACAVLHNICIKVRDRDIEGDEAPPNNIPVRAYHNENRGIGPAVRAAVVHRHFD